MIRLEQRPPACPNCFHRRNVVECHLNRRHWWWFCTICGWESEIEFDPRPNLSAALASQTNLFQP